MMERCAAVCLEFGSDLWYEMPRFGVLHRPVPGWPLVLMLDHDGSGPVVAWPAGALHAVEWYDRMPGQRVYTMQDILDDLGGTRAEPVIYTGRSIMLADATGEMKLSPRITGAVRHH